MPVHRRSVLEAHKMKSFVRMMRANEESQGHRIPLRATSGRRKVGENLIQYRNPKSQSGILRPEPMGKSSTARQAFSFSTI